MNHIKNPQIKHMIRRPGMYAAGRYLCITAVDTTPEKSVKTWDKVTCKNCLARMPPEAKRRMLNKPLNTRQQPSKSVAFSGYFATVPPHQHTLEPSKLQLVKENEEQMKLRDRLAYSAGYAQGMRDGILGNYIIIAAALVLAILLVVFL